jgi:hypothetical protein
VKFTSTNNVQNHEYNKHTDVASNGGRGWVDYGIAVLDLDSSHFTEHTTTSSHNHYSSSLTSTTTTTTAA